MVASRLCGGITGLLVVGALRASLWDLVVSRAESVNRRTRPKNDPGGDRDSAPSEGKGESPHPSNHKLLAGKCSSGRHKATFIS